MPNPKKLPKWAIKQAGGINKKAWALARRGRGKAAKPKKAAKSPKSKSKGSRIVTKTSNPKRAPKIGAGIQAFKGAHAVAAPLVEAGIRTHAGAGFVPSIRRAANLDTAGSLAVEGLNQAVDRKIAQGAALTGGSVTAWGAEAFAGWRAFEASRGAGARDAVRQVNTSLSTTIRGYDPQSARMRFLNDDQRNYNLIKIGGGIIRRASNMGPLKKVFAPAKKLLGSLGGRL